MTDDLVKRLREPVDDPFFGKVVEPIKWETADRIEELEGAIRQIVFDAIQLSRAALKKKQ